MPALKRRLYNIPPPVSVARALSPAKSLDIFRVSLEEPICIISMRDAMMGSPTYATSAKYYDDAYANAPILEMGCGTGRVLLPIARAGIEIHGLDSSASMLRTLREHMKREPDEVQR